MNKYQEAEAFPREPRPARVRPLWIVVTVLAAVSLMGFGILMGGGWLGVVKPALTQRVYAAEGVDTAECPGEFQVGDGWELRWEHAGELQEICWTNSGGKTECYTAMHRKPIRYHGSVNVIQGGTYRLRVTGKGRWKLEVYAL